MNLFTVASAKIFGGLTIALLVACVALWTWGKVGHANAARNLARAEAEATNHRTTKDNFRAAMKTAQENARAARLAHEAKSLQLAERADNHEYEQTAARDAAARFADARRLPERTGEAAGSAPGRTGAAGQADPATGGNGPGPDAVVLRRAEYDALVDNTLRLERVHVWGQSLIDEGLAVPSIPNKE